MARTRIVQKGKVINAMLEVTPVVAHQTIHPPCSVCGKATYRLNAREDDICSGCDEVICVCTPNVEFALKEDSIPTFTG